MISDSAEITIELDRASGEKITAKVAPGVKKLCPGDCNKISLGYYIRLTERWLSGLRQRS